MDTNVINLFDKRITIKYLTNKIKTIEWRYPPNKFTYHFSISDSESDLDLLKKFDHYILLK